MFTPCLIPKLACLLLSSALGFSAGEAQESESAMSAKALPLIIGHRGASRDAPENTLASFELAWSQGADGIEGDFFLTKDKQIVCFHDKDTKARTGVSLIVEDSTLEELQGLDVGSWKGSEFVGIKMPTLQEVIATVPNGKKLIIEIKSDEVIVPYLCEVLLNSGLSVDQILVLSFHDSAVKRLKEVAPQYKTTWAVGFKKDEKGLITPSVEDVLATQKDVQSDGVSTGNVNIPAGLSKRLQARGVEHHVWTVNNLEEARGFMNLSSITTDIPAILRAGLESVAPSKD